MNKCPLIPYFTWLRALGALAVVALHAIVVVHVAAGPDVLAPARVMVEGLFIIAFTRWAVPVFFMISGALLLDPARSMGWRKTLRHVWRMGFVLLTFGFAFCLAESYVKMGGFSVQMLLESVQALISGNSWDHLWFVYTIIGFYLLTPLVRPWVAQASREELGQVVLWGSLLLLGTKGLSAELPLTIYNLPGLPYCFAYYLMGYYVHNYLELNRTWVVLGLASLALMLGIRLFVGWEWVGDPIRGLVAPYAIFVMLLAKRYLNKPTTDYPLIELLADYSFGIYIVHPVFQHALVMLVDPLPYNAVLVTVVLTVTALVLSVALIWLLRKIPGFKGKV